MLEVAKCAARAALEAWRRTDSARHMRHSAPHVTRAGLVAGLAGLGWRVRRQRTGEAGA